MRRPQYATSSYDSDAQAFFTAAGITDTEAANFYTAVETYQDALSRGVV